MMIHSGSHYIRDNNSGVKFNLSKVSFIKPCTYFVAIHILWKFGYEYSKFFTSVVFMR